ncbi:MAG: cell division protein ZapC domain-containing protein [Shewanella sp.]
MGNQVWLTTPYEQALFIVALAGNEASVCLSLHETLALNAHKSLSCFDVIKVMNNRITPLVSRYVQYSNVG